MARWYSALFALLLLPGIWLLPEVAMSTTSGSDYQSLVELWKKWRQFEPPAVANCVPDYSAAAMSQKAPRLAGFQRQLTAIDSSGWSVAQLGDKKLVAAEMSGMDFELRVLKPWARDPSFYANVYGEDSDVPEHEGPSISPAIDLQGYEYPLSKADQKKLTCLIGAIPALLEEAKVNLRDSKARDLWLYGGRAFREQSSTLAAYAAGTLEMRTLAGTKHAVMSGADPTLLDSIGKARAATDAFRAWIEVE